MFELFSKCGSIGFLLCETPAVFEIFPTFVSLLEPHNVCVSEKFVESEGVHLHLLRDGHPEVVKYETVPLQPNSEVGFAIFFLLVCYWVVRKETLAATSLA